MLAVGAGIGPEPHLAFVVKIEAVERELVRQTRRGRGNPEAPAALGPAIAEIGILMDVRFVQVDQQMAVMLGSCQEILDLLDKGLPTLRIGRPSSFLAFFQDSQAMQGGADGLAAAGPAERSPTQPTRRRSVSAAADRPGTGGVAAERWAARTVSPRPASISGQRGGGRRCADRSAPRGRGVVEMQPLQHRLRVTVRAPAMRVAQLS